MGWAAAASFAGMGSLAKLAYDAGASVVGVLSMRFFVGAAFFGVLLGPRLRTIDWRHPSTTWALAAGICGGALSGLAEFTAYRFLPVALVVVLLFLNPLWIAGYKSLVHDEHIGVRGWAAVALVLVGLLLLVSSLSLSAPSLKGVGLALSASVTAGILFLGIERGVAYHGPSVTAGLVVGSAFAVTAAIGLISGSVWTATATWERLGLVVLLGLVGCVAGYAFLTRAVSSIGAFSASVVTATEPVIAAVIAWAVVGETLSPIQILGGSVIVLGTVVATSPPTRR